MNNEQLEPIDVSQCQAEMLSGSFMTLGPRSRKRCTNSPTFVAIEKEPQEDNLRGGMSICEDCAEVLKGQIGEDHVSFQKIKRDKDE